MADKEPDKMGPEKRKKKTSHLSSTEIEAALNADADEVTTPKSTHSSSARRKLVLLTKIVSHEGSADLFEDSVPDISMPTMSESMLDGMSFIEKEIEREKDAES